MKLIYAFIFVVFFIALNAQAPQGINYQGVARNAAGAELTNQPVGLQLSIVEGSPSGTVVYTETHSLTTDASGLFSIVIGMGSPVSGTFSSINWAVGGSKFLKMSMDITGGTSYQLIGTSQLMSVPYALYAGNVANNGGKHTLVLAEDVNDVEAATIIANEVGPNTQEIIISGTTNLTTVDLSMITSVTSIQVQNNSALTTLNLGGLIRGDGQIYIDGSGTLNNLNLSSLTKITSGGLVISNIAGSSLNLPNLTKCYGQLTIVNNSNLTSLSAPLLEKITGSCDLTFNAMSTISLPALTEAQGVSVGYNSSLSSLNFPALVSVHSFYISNAPSITTVSFPSLITIGGAFNAINSMINSVNFPVLASFGVGFGGTFSMSNAKLSTSAVNYLLAKFISIPGLTSVYIGLEGQTPPAPPSGQGITDKATLIANGNSVSTD